MEISNEEYIKVRNEEAALIKDMSIEAIKARIMDYEMQRIVLRARQQSCLAIIQEDEKKRSVAAEMKNIINKETIVDGSEIRAEKEKEQKKTLSKIDKQVESWRGMKLPEATVRVMARMLDPTYRFEGEKDVKKHYLTCPVHGKQEISKEEYETQQKNSNGWICTLDTDAQDEKGNFIKCVKACTYEAVNEIIDTNN